MKVLLNLLPEEGRTLIRRKYHNRFFLWQAIMLFIAELVYGALLVGTYVVLRMEYFHAEAAAAERVSTQTDSKVLGGYESKFQDTNRLVAQSINFTKKHLEWANLFVRFDGLVPDDVTLTRLVTKDYTISLSGVAKTRDGLLLFEQRVKADDCFTGIDLPVSNLFSQENIDFQLNFSVKDACVKETL